MVRRFLLGCGIVSSVWYVITDLIGTLRYPGYSYADQWFSELTAQGGSDETPHDCAERDPV
jgi:hypothetical protein